MENVINFDLLKEYDGTLKEVLKVWQKQKSYSVGDTVQYKGNYLKCTTAGTSGTTTLDFTGLDVGDTIIDGTVVWEVIEPPSSAGGGISIWQANTSYNVNDVVIDSNLIWQCATSHTSTTTFDESKWICISGGEVSNGLEIVTLWEGSLRFNDNTPQQLNDNISNYDFLLFNLGTGSNKGSSITEIIDVKDLSSTAYYRLFGGHHDYIWQAEIRFSSSTQFYISDYIERNNIDPYIYKVQGIRKAKPIVSSGMKYETLWEGEVGSLTSSSDSGVSITLQDSLRKYKKIGLYMEAGFNGDNPWPYYREISTDMYFDFVNNGSNGQLLFTNGFTQQHDYIRINSGTDSTMVVAWYSAILTKIIGISEGVQIPTGVQAARVTLWEGFYNTVGGTITLSDSIENYNEFEVYASNSSSLGEKAMYVFSCKDINYTDTYQFRTYNSPNAGSNFYSFSLSFANATNLRVDSVDVSSNSWAGAGLYRIVGIKYIQPDSYSTEEKLIGTWIDGKPLYRKVFTGTTPSSLSVDTTLIDLNDSIDTFVNVFGSFVLANGEVQFFPMWYAGSSDYYYIYARNSSASLYPNTIRMGVYNAIYANRPFQIVIDYTKN